jgi:hypothetical protein
MTQPSTAELQQAMIEVCRIPRAPHIQTLAALLKNLEHHLKLPDNALEDQKDDIIDWFDLLNKLHIAMLMVQTFDQQPLQSSLEHHLGLDYGVLTPWQKAITNWTRPPKSTQPAPATQPLPNAHQIRSLPPTPATQLSTAQVQQAMIEVCHNPMATHIKSPAPLLKEIERHLELPDNALEEWKGDIEKWSQILRDLYIHTRAAQACKLLPLQSLMEHQIQLDYGALNPWKTAITNWTHSPTSTQNAPDVQVPPTDHQQYTSTPRMPTRTL